MACQTAADVDVTKKDAAKVVQAKARAVVEEVEPVESVAKSDSR